METSGLRPGDRIDTASRADMVVTSLTLTDRVEKTYNLTVADWHTFMVGEDEAIVHNVCEPEKLASRYLKNKHFRNWFHKVFKSDQSFGGGAGDRNPDMGAEDIIEAWDEWNELGQPEGN